MSNLDLDIFKMYLDLDLNLDFLIWKKSFQKKIQNFRTLITFLDRIRTADLDPFFGSVPTSAHLLRWIDSPSGRILAQHRCVSPSFFGLAFFRLSPRGSRPKALHRARSFTNGPRRGRLSRGRSNPRWFGCYWKLWELRYTNRLINYRCLASASLRPPALMCPPHLFTYSL